MNEDVKPRILLFTGDGKGKTTAALGLALRAAGHGLRVLVIQFVKSDERTGELLAAARIPEIEIIQTGLGFVPPDESPEFQRHAVAAASGLQTATAAIENESCHVLILDEICTAVARGLVDEVRVLEVLSRAKPGMTVVMTGRAAAKRLIDAADTVTEMRCIRHAHKTGRKARRGVEY